MIGIGPKRVATAGAAALFLVGCLVPASAGPGDAGTFAGIVEPYEKIRNALVQDTLEGVSAESKRLAQALDGFRGAVGGGQAGLREGGREEVEALLPEIWTSAEALAAAPDLATAREEFGRLSKALVQVRRWVESPETVVAFCSMAQKVWIQSKREIGNPYYGQSMARCGEIVSE